MLPIPPLSQTTLKTRTLDILLSVLYYPTR